MRTLHSLAKEELVSDIRRKTAQHNRNNLTRTKAYLEFYQRFPEIEWAFLAHMVSRNGGWEMTDLRGEWLPRLLDEKQIDMYFAFLERCNWLIFHDAYAQLLLYEKMVETEADLTECLLPLGVSRFMTPIWKHFLTHGNRQILTWGLIINEQQYIEQRVVRVPLFRKEVLDTIAFRVQAALRLDQILFPYLLPDEDTPRLVGIAVQHFPSLEDRIEVGKALYRLLFSDKERLNAIQRWAFHQPHTGSRADYWPHLYSTLPHLPQDQAYVRRLTGNGMIPGKPKIYSPRLHHVWKDTEQPPADGTDWFRDPGWYDLLKEGSPLPILTENEVWDLLNMVDAGLAIKNMFS